MHSQIGSVSLEEVVRIERAARQAQAEMIFAAFAGLYSFLRRAWQDHVARQQLESLDPRLLRDIGLTRFDIDAALEGRVVREAPAAAGNDNGLKGALSAA
ncbi:MAG: DUF1127 domain-containing protein [Alphaproteobacteria bacterium]|nr:DUF1127 domain-containing protein [Alphaproteobacteria bacterium]